MLFEWRKTCTYQNLGNNWAVVVAQLVERSLPTPEIHGSIPVIGNFLFRTFVNLLPNVLKRQKEKKKRSGMAHFFFQKTKQ